MYPNPNLDIHRFLLISPCTGPSPPTDFQTLCNVIVWGMPVSPNGELLGYQAQFYIPGTQLGVVREVAQDRTFYIVKEEDKLLSEHSSSFVRVINSCLKCTVALYICMQLISSGACCNKCGTWSMEHRKKPRLIDVLYSDALSNDFNALLAGCEDTVTTPPPQSKSVHIIYLVSFMQCDMLTVQPVLHATVQPVHPPPHQLQHSYLPVIIVSHLVFTRN